MTITQYNVELTTVGGYTVTADDAAIAGSGAAVNAQLEYKEDICFATATGITVIPFAAVDHAIVAVTIATVADPTDPTCTP